MLNLEIMNNRVKILSLLIFGLFGCSEFLDVNENSNFPEKVEDYLILPSAQAGVASIMSADYGLIGSFWAQHWAQNNTSSQYKVFETYTLSSNDNRVDGPYLSMYRDGLGDNEIIHLKAEQEGNWGLYLMTSTLKAYGFQYLVDFYGNVPYDEAFKGEEGNFTPIINKGEEVYTAIYELLNTALDKDFTGFTAARYAQYDLLLGANINDWIGFANTLKLRIILRQYAVNTAWANTELANLLANGTFLTRDVALTNFEDVDSKSNPLFEADQRQLNTSQNIRANVTFTTYLKANNDSRLQALFAVVGGKIDGMIPGSYEIPSTVWNAPDVISKPIITATMPVYLMTLAETKLLLAEAYLRLGDVSSAESFYKEGVISSFRRMGADTTGMGLFNIVYQFPSTDFNARLKAIIMQKWVDAAEGQRGAEAFLECVRTGYPEPAAPEVQSAIPIGRESDLPESYIPGTLIYSKKGATNGNFPVRLPYPDSELNFNINAAEYKDLPDAEVMQTKVWWNQ
jgi:hypothetical protein